MRHEAQIKRSRGAQTIDIFYVVFYKKFTKIIFFTGDFFVSHSNVNIDRDIHL